MKGAYMADQKTAKEARVEAERDKEQVVNEKDPWRLVRKNFDRYTSLGSFADISQPPKITDVEIAVCFADIRGFTNYCNALQQMSLDSKIQNFLRDYFQIYPTAVLLDIWQNEPDEDEELKESEALIRKLIVPTSYKNLGDGVMLVWEIPSNTSLIVQGLLMYRIHDVIMNIFNNFDEFFIKSGMIEIDSYSEYVKDLRMGFGLARGHAWKLDFGHHLKFDYAGSIVNLAARLQDQARPEGIVSQYTFSQSLFDQFIKDGYGKIQETDGIKGLSKQKIVLMTGTEIRTIKEKEKI